MRLKCVEPQESSAQIVFFGKAWLSMRVEVSMADETFSALEFEAKSTRIFYGGLDFSSLQRNL